MVLRQVKIVLMFLLSLLVVATAVTAGTIGVDVVITPESPATDDTLTCDVKVTGAGEPFNVSIEWFDTTSGSKLVETSGSQHFNVTAGTYSLNLVADTTKNDKVKPGHIYDCIASVTDKDNSKQPGSKQVTVINDEPSLSFDSIVTLIEDKTPAFQSKLIDFDDFDLDDSDPEHNPNDLTLFTFTVAAQSSSNVKCEVTGSKSKPELKITTTSNFNTKGLQTLPTCTLRVSDGFDFDETSFQVEVLDVKDDPVITGLSTTSAVLGQTFSATVQATDADAGDTLTYALVSGPTGMTLSTAGQFSWVPTATGSFTAQVKVTDTTGAFDTETFTITVTEKVCVSFTDVDAAVSGGGKEDLSVSAGKVTGDIEVQPGSKFEIDFTLDNLCTDDPKIDNDADCDVEVELEELCDDCDKDNQDQNLDVDAEKKEDASFTFEIPTEADDGKYDLEVDIKCDDKDGAKNYNVFNGTISVEVAKETHQVYFSELTLNPTLVSCVRKPTLTVEVANVGEKDENVELSISNQELGIQVNEFFKLDEGDVTDDEDTLRRKAYTLNIDDSVKAGNYQIAVDAYYNANKDVEEEFLTLVVQDCGVDTTPSATKITTSSGTTTTATTTTPPPVTVVTTAPTTTTVPAKAQVVTQTPAKASFLESNGYLMLVIVAIVIVSIVILGLLVVAFRK